MSVRQHVAHVPGAVRPVVEVRNPAGSVAVEALDGSTELSVRVEALDRAAEELLDQVEIEVTEAGADAPVRVRVTVPERQRWGTARFAVSIGAPAGAEAHVAVASAAVDLRGRLDRVGLTSASGAARVEHCTRLQAHSASGDVHAGTVGGPATVETASGDVRLESVAGAVDVRTAAGDVEIGRVDGDVSVRTAAGDVGVGRVATGRVRLRTVSGDVTVGVLPGLRVWLDLASITGRMASDLTDEEAAGGSGPADVTVAAQSVSGNVRVRRTVPAG